ncbi:hypothetical protein ACIPL1_08830 [Pseudomonas sp. NPDC090202]|uniref:hypothetical protein n=1 Tax=unclassified Pseudomonas TaxID=196821 RepID=UPI0037F42D96
MNSHKRVQPGYALSPGVNHYGAYTASRASERIELIGLLQQYLTTTQELQQYAQSLELRLRNVSFVDVRQLFHRIGESAGQCAAFLDERLHDLGASTIARQTAIPHGHAPDNWHQLSFATCIQHIGTRTQTLALFASHIKSYMDRAVINGDYNSLHVMTDCVYQLSQLIALIQIHIPLDAADELDSPFQPHIA